MDSGQKPSAVAQRWRKVAHSENSAYTNTIISENRIKSIAESAYILAIIKETEKGAVCLETGCGSGTFSLALATLGHRPVCLDISEKVLANIGQNSRRLTDSYEDFNKPLGVQGDIELMPFRDDTFDVVFSEGVIEHWIDRNSRILVIKEMIRILKPKGRLVLFVPNGRHPFYHWWQLSGYPGYKSEDMVPWHRFTSAELAGELIEAGLSEVEHDGISPWSTLGVWPDWLPFRALAGLCRRIFPAPLWFRRKFGFNLMASGKK